MLPQVCATLLLASTSLALRFNTSTNATIPSQSTSPSNNSSQTFAVSLPTSSAIVGNVTNSACPASQILGQYWPNWGTKTQAPENIYFNRTDFVFYFVIPTTQDGFTPPAGQDLITLQNFVQVAHKNGKKAILTFGGWNGSIFFSELVSTALKGKLLASAMSTFMRKYSFDGIDIDWEFPGQQGAGSNIVSPSDSANFLTFLRILRSQIGPNKILHAAVSSAGFIGSDGAPLNDLSSYAAVLDYVTIMAYDFFSSSISNITGPNGPLVICNAQSGSVKTAVQHWILAGFPACKIILGIGTYSHIFKTSSNKLISTTYENVTTLAFQALASKDQQPKDNSTTFNQLITKGWLESDGVTGAGGFQKYWDHCTSTPFLFNPTTQLFLSYDDTTSSRMKAQYANKMGLAGVNLYDSTGASIATYQAVRVALDAGVA